MDTKPAPHHESFVIGGVSSRRAAATKFSAVLNGDLFIVCCCAGFCTPRRGLQAQGLPSPNCYRSVQDGTQGCVFSASGPGQFCQMTSSEVSHRSGSSLAFSWYLVPMAEKGTRKLCSAFLGRSFDRGSVSSSTTSQRASLTVRMAYYQHYHACACDGPTC